MKKLTIFAVALAALAALFVADQLRNLLVLHDGLEVALAVRDQPRVPAIESDDHERRASGRGIITRALSCTVQWRP